MSFACTFFFFICHMLLILFEQIDLIECLVSCCWICILHYRKPCNEPDFLPISPFPPLIIIFSFIFIYLFFSISPYYIFGCLLMFVFCLSSCMFRPRPVSPACFPYPTTPLPHSAPGRPYPTLGANKTLAGGNSATSWASTPSGLCALLGHPNHQPSICKLPSWFAISQTPLPDWGLGWTHCRQHHDLLPMLCIF